MDQRILPEQIFMSFVRELRKLVVTDGIKLDLVVSAGDSGIAMAKYVELVLEELSIPMPPTVVLPIYRHKDAAETVQFDYKVFLPQVENVVKSIGVLKNVLFVDDEIGSGSVAQAMLDLVLEARKGAEVFSYYILAENHGFIANNIHGTNVIFSPFSQRREGLWSLILRLPSDEAVVALSPIIPECENKYKYITNLLLSLPVKEIVFGEARFTSAYLEIAEKEVPHLTKLRENHNVYLKMLIRSAMQN